MEFSIEAEAEQGLAQIVLSADRLANEKSELPVMSVEMSPGDESETGPFVFVEALFGMQDGRRIIAQLDLRVRFSAPQPDVLKTAGEALEQFGGVELTSLSVSRGQAKQARELCDLTVSFGTAVPFYASNVVLLGSFESGDSEACAKVFEELGVRFHHVGATLQVSRHQLRGKPSPAQQLAALTMALRQADQASIYAAPIPAFRSASVSASTSASDATSAELWLSRGLSRQQAVLSSDCAPLQRFVAEHCGATFGGRPWRVNSVSAEPVERERGPGVIHDRKRPEWSLNWGVKR